LVLPKLLAFDTAFSACSVGLLLDNKIHTQHVIAPQQQDKLILSEINNLLKTHHLELKDLNALAFGCGPGSFTGVRIAATVAQSLSYATHVPIIRISSLATMAQTAYEEKGWKRILVAVDARMGQIYWGAYELGEDGLMVGKEGVLKPELVPIPEGEWYGVGDGWPLLSDVISLIDKDMEVLPKASGLLSLAKNKFELRQFVAVHEALPEYFDGFLK
jgi:tRNA threonylcarbamoyladenosine biosynthesis protein TsaB